MMRKGADDAGNNPALGGADPRKLDQIAHHDLAALGGDYWSGHGYHCRATGLWPATAAWPLRMPPLVPL